MQRHARWAGRLRCNSRRLYVPANRRIKLADVEDFGGFGEGWAQPDGTGIWTRGARAELEISLGGGEEGGVLRLGIDGISFERGGSIRIELLANGNRIAARNFSQGHGSALPSLRRPLSPRSIQMAKALLPSALTRRLYPLYWRMVTPATFTSGVSHLKEIAWRVELPADVVSRRNADLTFLIGESETPAAHTGWSSERELGIHLRSLMLETRDRHRSRSSLFRRLAVGQRTAAAD